MYYDYCLPSEAKSMRLNYSNQMEFKSWARRHGLSKKNGADFYFDSIYPVDARDPMSQNTIPGFTANGKTTWEEALKILKGYFKIAA